MTRPQKLTCVLVLLLSWAPLAQAQPPEGDEGASAEDEAPPEGMEVPDPQPPQPPPPQPPPPPAEPPAASHETVCDDRQDDDGDGLPDCADADCFSNAHCQAGGAQESTNDTCSDWIDNDGDGAVDCEDDDCGGSHISVCSGSWHGGGGGGGGGGGNAGGSDDIPELEGDMSVEDLIGRAGDADGERNDYLCADGIDNDADGRTDCQDFGCRFDPSVTVCTQAPGFRFSVVAGIGGTLNINELPDNDGDGVTEITDPIGQVGLRRLQLRALGQIPMINNSFFLINVRAERAVRITFATFNIPLNNEGHYLSINTGSGNLSPSLIVSTSKQPLLDPPFYLVNAFEQRNGAALEVGGPITEDNMLRFRLFTAGGSGEATGNVGGVFFRPGEEARNFAYTAGAQLHLNIAGNYDRFDTPFIYTPVPLTVAVLVGGRWDQRPVERFVAWNAFAILRYSHVQLRAETYGRYVLDFDGIQTSWNFQAVALIVPRTLSVAVDVGGFFVPLEYDPTVVAGTGFSSLFRQPVEEFNFRAAMHWFYFRNIGILMLAYGLTLRCQRVFSDQCLPSDADPSAALTEHQVTLEAQFRF